MEDLSREALPEAHQKLAEVIGLEATIRLCEVFGGAPLYIPKLDALVAARRGRMIRAEYDGANTAVLARRYGVSMRTVQLIVSQAPKRRGGGRMDDGREPARERSPRGSRQGG